MLDRGITVVIPTIGRETLKGTLASLVLQLNPEDAVVVICEEPDPEVRATVCALADCYPESDWAYIEHQGGDWGHPNRNFAMDRHVHTSHVWTLDDDDVATSTALDSLRQHMADPWTIFRMNFGPGHPANGITCWREKLLQAGDIGTPMIFAPLGSSRFGHEYMGDYVYAQQLREEHGEPVWSEDVVCVVRPTIIEDQ